jgi:hypothetical protein
MRYGGNAVAEAEMVATDEFPFEETWFDKFKSTVPDPVKVASQNSLTAEDEVQPCGEEASIWLLYIKSRHSGNAKNGIGTGKTEATEGQVRRTPVCSIYQCCCSEPRSGTMGSAIQKTAASSSRTMRQ